MTSERLAPDTEEPETEEPDAHDAVEPRTSLARFAWVPVAVVALTTSAVMLALAGRYGVHRDEFYYLAGGRRLAWGFVDHPPLTPFLARMQAELFGTSVTGFRVLPSLATGVLVFVGALIARELGGGRRSQLLAALAIALLPATRAPHVLFGTTSTDQVFWAILVFFAVRLLRTRDARWWIAIGGVAGIGLLNKHTILFALVMIVGGLFLTPGRRLLLNRQALCGGILALALWAPNVVWQLTHGLPVREMSESISADNGGPIGGLPDFVLESLALWAIVGAVVAWWGLRWLLRAPEGRPWRALGRGTVLVVPLVALSGGKSYYLAPLALVLAPAASVAIEASATRRRTMVTLLVVGALVSLPMTMPVLPPEQADAVAAVNKELGEMVGWDDLAHQVADISRGLSPDEQATAVVFTGDYSEAGVVELYRDELGLPPAFSGHNSYADWGRPPDGALPVIIIGIDASRLTWCRDLTYVGPITNRWDVDNEESGQPIHLCRSMSRDWSEIWPELRHVN
jgi:hypothetical protein